MSNSNKEKFEEIDRLSSKIDVILESIAFWEERMDKCFSKCDEIENNQWLPDLDKKISNVRKEMQFILNKVHAEERELDVLDVEIAKIYKEIISSET
tara:strand:+ start:2227 stop:2517 length:291 start_codon:yes stop_codon:yes gene_type:complete